MKTFLLVSALLLLIIIALAKNTQSSLIEGFGWYPRRHGWGGHPRRYGWGGGYRQGPVYFGPGRFRTGNVCDCHYHSGHVLYAGGKCYRPWGSRIDPRDPCY